MPNSLERVIIVTGAASGIGSSIARRFASENSAVVVADINVRQGESVVQAINSAGGHASFIHTDVGSEESVRSMVTTVLERFHRLDVLVNNAGIEFYALADEVSTDEWQHVQNINLRGAWLCAKYCLPQLKIDKGVIINIASIQGFACERGVAPYAATKAGLMALTRGMALDFAPDGVRVNAICPGAIQTGMMEQYLANEPDPESILRKMREAIPLHRVGEPDDIAGAAWFLASGEASYITGASLVVDGGVLARHAL